MESGDSPETRRSPPPPGSEGKRDEFVPPRTTNSFILSKSGPQSETILSAPLRPVTLLILLPAAAGTRIVPPRLLPRHHRRRNAHERQLRPLALILALDVARDIL